MKEELISLATAKLAKEKGFKEICNNAFRKDDNIPHKFDSGCCYETLAFFYILCPTQSLLQRWLREKHNIDVVVLPWRDHAGDVNDKHTYRPMIFKVKTFGEYSTYEEALEIGLMEALNLIPNE